MPQDTAYLIVNGKKILVLRRTGRISVSLKIRTSGKDGMFLQDESKFLEQSPDVLSALKRGEVVLL